MSKYDLMIDTSIFGAAVALGLTDGVSRKLAFSEVTHQVQDSARQLPLIVEQGMSQVGIEKEDIGRIIVSRGPGSFTGIRVGLAYAYGFLRGLFDSANPEAKIAGVSSLEVLADHWGQSLGEDLVLFLPSTKTTGYAAILGNGSSSLLPVDISSDIAPGLLGKLWLVLGEWAGIQEVAKKADLGPPKILDPRDNARLALGAINDRLLSNDDFEWSLDMPQALYLRKSTVEEKAEAGK